MAQGRADAWRRQTLYQSLVRDEMTETVTHAGPRIGFEAMGGLYEPRADKDAVVGLAGEVWDGVDGAIVLAVGVIELYADPEACREGGVSDEAHDAATLGDLDDGVERNGGVGHGARRGTRRSARRSSSSQV